MIGGVRRPGPGSRALVVGFDACGGQAAARQLGNDRAERSALTNRKFTGRGDHIVVDVQRRSHQIDDNASAHQGPGHLIGRSGAPCQGGVNRPM
ncbi:hypothetical protein A4G26_05360 [Mycobacterium kansasii]|nr:hypothetical protein A4G26_05360 [Mycobacterium kansasii]